MLIQYVSRAQVFRSSRLCSRSRFRRTTVNLKAFKSEAISTRTNPALSNNNIPNDSIKAGDRASDAAVLAATAPDGIEAGSQRTRSRRPKPVIPPRLLASASDQHDDLISFLAYADRTGLKSTTTVYKGTLYEYTVAESLSRFGFSLYRTGRSNDLGIDLVGHWTVPTDISSKLISKHDYQDLRVLVQCKATKPQPAMVRELEGAYVGAPSGWCGDGVLAFLVTSEPATKGVREAVQRSRWPLCVLQVTPEGKLHQLLWNAAAAKSGLEGLGVTVRHGRSAAIGYHVDGAGADDIGGGLALTWLGKTWKSAIDAECIAK